MFSLIKIEIMFIWSNSSFSLLKMDTQKYLSSSIDLKQYKVNELKKLYQQVEETIKNDHHIDPIKKNDLLIICNKIDRELILRKTEKSASKIRKKRRCLIS